MKRPPAFQFYVDNFVEGTCDMTDAEVGFYVRLLCAQWSRGGLPNDDDELMRFSRGCTTVQLQRIKTKFQVGEDGKLRNRRLEAERQKQIAWREKSAEGGKKSATTRKGGSRVVARVVKPRHQPNGQPKGNIPVSSFQSPSPDPSTPSSTPSPDSGSVAPPVGDAGGKVGEPKVAPTTEHAAFIDGWVQNFKTVHGFEYSFAGGKDGTATRNLLRTGIARIDLLKIAKQAWTKHQQLPAVWAFKQSVTIHGFATNLVAIRTELSNETNRRNRPAGHRATSGAEQRQLGIPERPASNLGELLARKDAAANRVATPPPATGGDQPGSSGNG